MIKKIETILRPKNHNTREKNTAFANREYFCIKICILNGSFYLHSMLSCFIHSINHLCKWLKSICVRRSAPQELFTFVSSCIRQICTYTQTTKKWRKKNEREKNGTRIIWIKYEVMGDDEKLLPIIQSVQIKKISYSIYCRNSTYIQFDCSRLSCDASFLQCIPRSECVLYDDKITFIIKRRAIFTCFHEITNKPPRKPKRITLQLPKWNNKYNNNNIGRHTERWMESEKKKIYRIPCTDFTLNLFIKQTNNISNIHSRHWTWTRLKFMSAKEDFRRWKKNMIKLA